MRRDRVEREKTYFWLTESLPSFSVSLAMGIPRFELSVEVRVVSLMGILGELDILITAEPENIVPSCKKLRVLIRG